MTKPQIDKIKHLTTGQAAKQLGVSHRTMQLWAGDGTIPCLTTAHGHRRFARAHVELLRERLTTRRENGPQHLPTLSEYASADTATIADTAAAEMQALLSATLATLAVDTAASSALLAAHDHMRAAVSLPPLARTPGDDRTLANAGDVTTHAAFVRGVLWLRAQLLSSLSTTSNI